MGGAAQAIAALSGMSATPQQAPAADPNAADPYAPYGGYQAYCAMCKSIKFTCIWDRANHFLLTGYAALAQNGQGGQGQPQMPPQ
jgi:far upstream element-binding protein